MGETGDLNETYFVGKVDKASEDLVRSTYECLEKAIAIGIYVHANALVYGFVSGSLLCVEAILVHVCIQ